MRPLISLALACLSIATASTPLTHPEIGAASSYTAASHTVTGSNGTLTAPTKKGQPITAINVLLRNGGKASVTCPITSFGVGTYQWNWTCSGGALHVRGALVASVSGKMTLTCSGGGRYQPTVCYHKFSGTAKSGTVSGPIAIDAKGGANNAPGTVMSFSATY